MLETRRHGDPKDNGVGSRVSRIVIAKRVQNYSIPQKVITPRLTVRDGAAWAAAVGLTLILALRLTFTETIENGLQAAVASAPELSGGPQPGAAATVGLAVATLALAAVAARAGRIRRVACVQLALIAAFIAWLAFSAFHAANRFTALVGTFDVATAVLAGWATGAAVAGRQGEPRRRWVFAVLIAMLGVWCAKGCYQRFVEMPDTLHYYYGGDGDAPHKQDVWKVHGWHAGDPAVTLFESRMKSMEVSGYVTFSNVMAEGLIPLVLLAAGAGLALVAQRNAGAQAARGLRLALGGMLLALAAAGGGVILMTASKGASAACLLCLLILVVGFWARRWVFEHRSGLRRLAAAGALVLLIGTLGFGLTFDRLPGKSLLFRWHYWTASARIVKDHPLLGVGLNNFGDYYPQAKRPSSPEDVRDPHNPIVRFAAEGGLPAAALWMALIVLTLREAFRAESKIVPNEEAGGEDTPPSDVPGRLVLGAGAFCLAWWALRFPLAESSENFNYIMTVMMLLVALVFMLLGAVSLRSGGRFALHTAARAATVGCAGMLLYDQVNMALVTGPVAMLFWVAMGASGEGGEGEEGGVGMLNAEMGSTRRRWEGDAVAAVLGVSSIVLAYVAWWPMTEGAFGWDPANAERAFAEEAGLGHLQEALSSLNDAIRLDPHSPTLLQQRAFLKAQMGINAADDVRQMFQWEPYNFRRTLRLAESPALGLTPEERRSALERALWSSNQLPPDEPQRLTPEEQSQATTLLHQLPPH